MNSWANGRLPVTTITSDVVGVSPDWSYLSKMYQKLILQNQKVSNHSLSFKWIWKQHYTLRDRKQFTLCLINNLKWHKLHLELPSFLKEPWFQKLRRNMKVISLLTTESPKKIRGKIKYSGFKPQQLCHTKSKIGTR